MASIAADYLMVAAHLDSSGVRLAGLDGTGEPEIYSEGIAFDGPIDYWNCRAAPTVIDILTAARRVAGRMTWLCVAA